MRFFLGAMLSFIVVAGCDKEAPPGPAPAASGSTRPAAAPAGGCAGAGFKSDKYGFCIDLPNGFKQSSSDSPGDDDAASFRFLNEGAADAEYGEIDISVAKLAEGSEPWELMLLDREVAKPEKKKVEEAALGKTGKFAVLKGKGINIDDYTFVMSAIVGPKYSVGCRGGGDTAKKAAAIESAKKVCKSLRTP